MKYFLCSSYVCTKLVISKRVGFKEKKSKALLNVKCEICLENKEKNQLNRKKGINTPNCKPKLTFLPGRGGRNPACISEELNPAFLLRAVLMTSTICEKGYSHTSINQINS